MTKVIINPNAFFYISGLFPTHRITSKRYRHLIVHSNKTIASMSVIKTKLKSKPSAAKPKVLQHKPTRKASQSKIPDSLWFMDVANSLKNVIIFSLDKKYCYTSFNRNHRLEMKKIWQMDIKVGMNMLDCMRAMPAIRKLAKRSMDLALKGKSFVETRYQPGIDKYYEISWNPILHAKEIIGISVITEDVSNRKKTEIERDQFARFFLKSLDLKAIIDSSGRFKKFNPAWTRLLGYSDVAIQSSAFVDFVHPDEQEACLKQLKMLVASGSVFNFENRFVCKDGTVKWFSLRANYFEKESVVHITGQEIGEQKKVTSELAKLNDLYALITKINHLTIHAVNRINLFQKISTIAVETGKFRMSWIGILDESTHLIEPVAWAGHEKGYLDIIEPLSSEDIPEGRGPTGRAVREGKSVICDDMSLSPPESKWVQEALDRGYLSSISLPIREHTKVVGALSLYSDEVNYFSNASEVKLLENIAENISFSLEKIQLEEERFESAAALLDSESRYRMLAENALDVIWTMDLNGKFTYISPSVSVLRGFTPEEVMKQSFEEFVSPGSQKLVAEKMQQQFKAIVDGIELPHQAVEVEQPCKDGSTVWTEVKGRTLFDHDGIAVGIIAISRNIQERKKSEEKIRQLSQAVEQSPVSIVITDTDARIQYVNRNFVALTGYTIEEAIGQNPRILQSGFTHTDGYADLWDNLTKGEVWNGEFRNRKKNGELYWESAKISPIVNEEGKITHYLAIKEDITQRKLLEEELSIQKRFFEQMFMQSSVSTQILDREGWCQRINPKLSELFGVQPAGMEGHVYNIFKDEALRESRVIPLLESVFKEGKHVTWEVNFDIGLAAESQKIETTKKDSVWFQNWAYPIFDQKGNVENVVIQHTDISERKNAELQVAASEHYFRALIENISDAIVANGHDSSITFQSRAAEKILGYSLAERQKISVMELVHPDQRKMFQSLFEKIKREPGVSFPIKYKMKHKNGSYIWVEGTVQNLLADPYVKAIIATYRDVTEAKDAEERLAARERKFRTLLEHNYDGITLNNERAEVLYQSPGVERITGFSFEERVGKSTMDMIHPEDLEAAYKVLHTVLAQPNHLVNFGFRVHHKRGHYVWIEGVINNLLQDPNVGSLVANYRDVTERKRAEQLLQQLNADLESRVTYRTAELATLNKELEGFTYSVSHDLRAPLRVIDGFCQMLSEDYREKLGDEGAKDLQVIMSNTKRMGQLIDDLLRFSRLGRAEMHMTSVNMNGLVQEVVQEISLGGTKIPDLKIDTLTMAQGDANLLMQVWHNLISNAIKYSGKVDNPVIEIGMMKEDPQVYFIRDNGAGFDMKYYHKLFGVFQRLHKLDDFTGTGVGLALVQRIIFRHGGTIWAEAQPNKGATFYFKLKRLND